MRAFCAARGIELETGSRDLRRFRAENRLNLEHAASLSRYDFFKTLANKIPGARVATAHNRSDLSETFFIKLFRGSGLQGLSAIFQNKEKKIIRPLLLFRPATSWPSWSATAWSIIRTRPTCRTTSCATASATN